MPASPKLAPLAPGVGHGLVGQPLAPHIQQAIEHSFLVDLSGVRIHLSPTARKNAAALSARAFAYGSDIFLGPGEHPHDLGLMAHEAAHVVQQQGGSSIQAWSGKRSNRFENEADSASSAVLRGEPFQIRERVSGPQVQRLGIADALNYFADAAYNIPGYRMFTLVIGINPINMQPVDRSPGNVLRALVEFLPGGHLITQGLDKYGILDKVGGWMQQQLDTLAITGASIWHALDTFLNSLKWSDIFHLGSVWERAKTIFTEPIQRIKSFVVGLVEGIWKFVREAILKPLAELASKTAGWDLLCAVLGTNPITGEAVPRTAETLIGGFMKLIHEDEVWANIKKANAIPRAWAWFQGALSGLMGFVRQIPALFLNTLHSLEWTDIINLPAGFRKVAGPFGSFLGSFLRWAGDTVWTLLQLIFEVVAPAVMPYLKKVGAAFKKILKDPISFMRNLIAAAKLGFVNFGSNFLTHLKAGLIDWLTGSLPGVYIPTAISLPEVGKFAMSVLGITWAQIRGKIVKALGPSGEKIMVALENTFDVVVALVKGGPAAAWELIKEKLTNLKDMVIGGITSFVIDTIVKKAIPKLISMFVPGAGFVSAIMSIYDTIMVFVQKLAKIMAAVKAFVDSIVAIANGQLEAAAKRVETTLGGLLSLAISFLAGFLGLGNITRKVLGVIEKIRAAVDKAIDTAITWVVTKAKGLFAKLFGKDKQDDRTDERTDEQKQAALRHAVEEAEGYLFTPSATPESVSAQLPALKEKYRLKSIVLKQTAPGEFDVEIEVNPKQATRRQRFDPENLKLDDVVLGMGPSRPGSSSNVWIPGVVTSVDPVKKRFVWKSSNQSMQRTGVFDFADQDKTWKKGHVSQVTFSEDRMAEENKKQAWDDLFVAIKVLNYRHHGAETNPPGTQWEHIIEKSAGGAHSSGNLALTSSVINNRLGKMFEKAYASHEAPDGLPGTDGKELREFLKGQTLYVQNRWKQHFYGQLQISLNWKSSDRGIWRELS